MARSFRTVCIKQFYAWHWISSAICLFSMLLFAFTGITLNHAGEIPSEAKVRTVEAVLPAVLLEQIAMDAPADGRAPLTASLRDWLRTEHDVSIGGRLAEWSDDEIYLDLPRPGGDGWLSLDMETGELLYESTYRGWISYLNDLHKGRDTGTVWRWFLDVFSVACVIFCLTGLGLLWVHARRRPSTWPIVIGGIVIPVILALFFIAH